MKKSKIRREGSVKKNRAFKNKALDISITINNNNNAELSSILNRTLGSSKRESGTYHSISVCDACTQSNNICAQGRF